MATFKMQRRRGDFGHVPAKVLEALVQSSREDLGAAYRRLDYCHQLAPGGGRPFADSVRRYLVGEGLTPAEVETVTEHVCGPAETWRQAQERLARFSTEESESDRIASGGGYFARSKPRAARRNPGPVNILATYSAADAGKHPILDAALEIADLAKLIPVPYVRTSVSQIGGPHRASTIVTVGFDPRETWTNGIFENSRYARFDVSPGPQFSPYAGKSTTEPTIELISGHGVPKFRKARFKTPADAIAKIAKWASEAGAKRNPKGGFRAKRRASGGKAMYPAIRFNPANLQVGDRCRFSDKWARTQGPGYETMRGTILRILPDIDGYDIMWEGNTRPSRMGADTVEEVNPRRRNPVRPDDDATRPYPFAKKEAEYDRQYGNGPSADDLRAYRDQAMRDRDEWSHKSSASQSAEARTLTALKAAQKAHDAAEKQAAHDYAVAGWHADDTITIAQERKRRKERAESRKGDVSDEIAALSNPRRRRNPMPAGWTFRESGGSVFVYKNGSLFAKKTENGWVGMAGPNYALPPVTVLRAITKMRSAEGALSNPRTTTPTHFLHHQYQQGKRWIQVWRRLPVPGYGDNRGSSSVEAGDRTTSSAKRANKTYGAPRAFAPNLRRRNPHDARGRYHGEVKGKGRTAKIQQYTEGGGYHVIFALVHRDGEEQVVNSPQTAYKTLAAAERKARTWVDDTARRNPFTVEVNSDGLPPKAPRGYVRIYTVNGGDMMETPTRRFDNVVDAVAHATRARRPYVVVEDVSKERARRYGVG